MDKANTSYVEHSNLTLRMGNRRFTRLTNGFSKNLDKHAAMVHFFFLHYNFCRIHKTLGVTPAMEAGITDKLRDMEWVVSLIDYRAVKPKRPTTYKKEAISGIRNELSSISTCVERVARRFRLHGTCLESAQGCRGRRR